MSYKLTKEIKLNLTYLIILLVVVNIFNYFYQVNYTKKLYLINLSLKHNISFNIKENDKDFDKIISAGKTHEKYQRSLQLKMEEKISYEIDYDKNLINISKNCTSLKANIKGQYYFISCTSPNVLNIERILIENMSKVLVDTLNDLELVLRKRDLNERGVTQNIIKENNFNIISSKTTYTRNILKNIILANAIIIFIFVIYLLYKKRIKQIIF